jgi:uncharacterized membrane protein (DUF106 family)
MLDAIYRGCLAITEPVLGWLLYLPRDAALVIVSLGTALVLTLVRIKTTDQGLLRRCRDDKKRQKQLVRAARKQGDREARKRHRAIINQIGLKAVRQEGWPLLASLVPIALIAVWAFAHIPYHAPDPEEGIVLRMYFPADAIAELVHMLPPEEGVRVSNGLIRRVEEDYAEDGVTVAAGRADWTLSAKKRDAPYKLRIRWQGNVIEHELRADGLGYTGPLTRYGPKREEVFEYQLGQYKYCPFAVLKDWDVRIPRWTIFRWTVFGPYAGQRMFTVDGWLLGYLLIVVPFAFLFRPLLRIH